MKAKGKIPATFYIFTIPLILLFFYFHTFPFLKGVFYSFTDWKGYGDWNFVGLRNYFYAFTNKDVLNSYVFTFKFALAATILVNLVSLSLALGLNSKIKFQNTLKAIYFLPYILGSLIIGFVFNFIFGNLLPQLGEFLNIEFLSSNILGTEHAWLGILFVAVWQGLAFNTLIYLSGLQTVNQEIYEAATIDGASAWQKFKRITFPLIAPFFTINLVLSVKGFLMVFDQIMAMTKGGPGNLTTSISVLIYKRGFQGTQFSVQSANAVILFLVIAIISIVQLRILEKREEKMS